MKTPQGGLNQSAFRSAWGAVLALLLIPVRSFGTGDPPPPTCDVRVASLSYNGAAKVWKGTVVTWTVTSDPAGHESELTISHGTLDGTTITFTCDSTSVDSSTPAVTVAASGCVGEPLTSDGPVVFGLVSATANPTPVCQGDAAHIDWIASPDNTGLVPTFSGDNVDAAGYILGTSANGNPLAVGNHDFLVSGDRTLTTTLTVLTGNADEWTLYHPAIFQGADDYDGQYDFYSTYWLQDVYVVVRLWARGTIHVRHEIIDDLVVQGGCGESVTYSKNKAFGITISGGVPSYLSAAIVVGVSQTVTKTLGPTVGKRYKMQARFPQRTVTDTRNWQTRPMDESTYWIDLPQEQGGQGTYTIGTFLLPGYGYDEWAACCN
jgi:hypothetical protein